MTASSVDLGFSGVAAMPEATEPNEDAGARAGLSTATIAPIAAPLGASIRRVNGSVPSLAELRAGHGHLSGPDLLRALLDDGPLTGQVALVSSFGVESAVLLHIAATIDLSIPVIFIDTLKHFPATLAYRDQLVRRLGLLNVRSALPDTATAGRLDPVGTLFQEDPDACCHLRKTEPLQVALDGFVGWITGRKRFQGGLRGSLPVLEAEPGTGRLKINPLATWSEAELDAYRRHFDLPIHPLLAHGYRSVGCQPCTVPVRDGESPRAGRWAGLDKTECGIHVTGGAGI